MTNIDEIIAGVREECRPDRTTVCRAVSKDEVLALCDEIERLRALLLRTLEAGELAALVAEQLRARIEEQA